MTNRIVLYQWIIEVAGAGHFPIDMLRYDMCVPETAFDSGMIEAFRDYRTVKLRCFTWAASDKPGDGARWKSFGWNITRAYKR